MLVLLVLLSLENGIVIIKKNIHGKLTNKYLEHQPHTYLKYINVKASFDMTKVETISLHFAPNLNAVNVLIISKPSSSSFSLFFFIFFNQ